MRKTLIASALILSILAGCAIHPSQNNQAKKETILSEDKSELVKPTLNSPLMAEYKITSKKTPNEKKVLGYTFISKDLKNFFLDIYKNKPKEHSYDTENYFVSEENYQFNNGTRAKVTVLDHTDADSNDYHYLWKKGNFYYEVSFINHTKEEAEKILNQLYPKN